MEVTQIFQLGVEMGQTCLSNDGGEKITSPKFTTSPRIIEGPSWNADSSNLWVQYVDQHSGCLKFLCPSNKRYLANNNIARVGKGQTDNNVGSKQLFTCYRCHMCRIPYFYNVYTSETRWEKPDVQYLVHPSVLDYIRAGS